MAQGTSSQRFLRLMLLGFVAGTLVGLGAYLLAFGNSWAPIVLGLLADAPAGGWLELFVPFLPMAPLAAAAAAASWFPR